MEPQRPPASAAPGATAPAWKQAGAIVRAARIRSGLTLADLGRQCGYSASQISRYERGVQPLTDVTLLRRFADVLTIPHHLLGLADPAGALASRHAETNQRMAAIGGPNLVGYFRPEDGDDPVRRRELLAGAAGLASAALLAPAAAQAISAERRSASFDDLLCGQPANPVSLTALRTAIAAKREEFQTARYDRLAAGLPGLIGMAMATRLCASGDAQSAASSLLADAYIVAANFMVKLNDDPLALTLADRALHSAQAGDDPLTTADASRAVATVLRRTGRRAKAHDLLLSAGTAIEPGRDTTPEQLSVYGTLLQVAAYTAAVDGNRATAYHLISEAKATAARLGRDANYRYTAFGPANVTLHQISIAQVLGDSGTAIEHAKTLRPSAIPTPERQGRYWIDIARAYHQWNKPEPCYRALLCAERAAPAEVRYRPPVHRMTEDLLRTRRGTLPGLNAFAQRIGMPAI
jgi:transcriptional regulator with XRE-family HTH domain